MSKAGFVNSGISHNDGGIGYTGQWAQAYGLVLNNGLTASALYLFEGDNGVTFSLPKTDGIDGQAIITNGSGQLSFGGINNSGRIVATVYNDSGITLTKGKLVYIKGAQGNKISVGLADATSESTQNVFGMVNQTILNGADGEVVEFGLVNNLNTIGLTAGLPIYLSTTPGGFTHSNLDAPIHSNLAGWVVRVHASVGEIFVRPETGYELKELHDVKNYTTASIADGSYLGWSASGGYWMTLPKPGTGDGDLLNGGLTQFFLPYYNNANQLNDSYLLQQAGSIVNTSPNGQIIWATGSNTKTSFRMGSMAANSGMYSSGDGLFVTMKGNKIAFFGENQIVVGAGGSSSLPRLSFDGDPDTGIYQGGTNQITMITGGATATIFKDGSARVPFYSQHIPVVNTSVSGFFTQSLTSNTYIYTLTGNATFSYTGATYSTYNFIVKAGSYTFNLNASDNYQTVAGLNPALTGNFIMGAIYDGTDLWITSVKNYSSY